jgi:cation diffusion facilitator family transporter
MSDGVKSIIGVINGNTIPVPGRMALWAAIASIISKEILYHATIRIAKRANSPVVLANAWHHRSDALSSVGAFVGIGGSMLLGDKWTVLDPIASCVISVVIVFVAVKMAVPCFAELLESSLPEEIEAEIESEMWHVDGVRDVHDLKTRRNGISFVIDAHVVVDPHITIVEAHNIATNVERRLRDKYGTQTQMSIHMEPDKASE